MRLRFWVVGVILLAICGCQRPKGPVSTPTPRTPGGAPVVTASATPAPGFVFKLSEGTEVDGGASPAPVPSAVPLAQSVVDKLLQRLPPPKTDDGDHKAFAMREKSLPPPLTGPTVKEAFPPPGAASPAPNATESGALQVLRHQPDGKVPMAPLLSITFSQPMVPLTSHDDLAQKDLPVKLQPQPAGKWRWAGTRTLIFEPAPRFPMATQYSLDVPAGTASATGGKLEKAAQYTFSTPAVRLVGSTPNGGPTIRDPLMCMVFDQKVDPKAILDNTKIVLGNSAPMTLRLATAEEVAADATVTAMSAGVEQDRFVAFKATSKLPADTSITLEVEAGAPSLEGPLKTEARQSFSFRTYGPLRITDTNCKSESDCTPGTPLYISFSNPIDGKRFDKSMVTVAPAIKGMKAHASGGSIVISGMTKGHTAYTATLDRGLTDAYGQNLEGTNIAMFHVGKATDSLSTTGGSFVVLDPGGKPAWPVYTVNHNDFRFTAYTVQPSDWPAFVKYLREWNNDVPASPPGMEVMSQVVPTNGNADELAETDVDLAAALPTGKGQVVVVVEPTTQPPEHYKRQKHIAWVQATNIGLEALADHDRLVVWTTGLADGKPMPDIHLGLSTPDQVSSDTNGIASIELPSSSPSTPAILIAKKDDDVAILPQDPNGYYGGYGWVKRGQSDSVRWYVFDDRKMYRPAEEVHVKGWLRVVGAGPKGDLSLPTPPATAMDWKLIDSRGNEVQKGTTKINAFGGFDLAFKLGKTMNLGSATLQLDSHLSPSGSSTTHMFQVQEFRRPEFEVSANTSDGPFFVGGEGDMAVNARYYAGGGLPGAPVSWTVSASAGAFTPPGRSEYTFGTWTPWWYYGGPDYDGPMPGGPHGRSRAYIEEDMPMPPGGGVAVGGAQSLAGKTDGNGKHRVHLKFISVSPPQPTVLSAQATVQDVNRQAWTGRTTMLVHPANLYVGLKAERMFVQQGDKMPVRFLVCDLDGKAAADKTVHLRLSRQEYSYETGSTEEVDVQERDRKSAGDAVSDEFVPREGGQYRLIAAIEDDKGRRNKSEITFWVAGGKQIPQRGVQKQKVDLIPDTKDHKVGDTAQILVQSPFPATHALLTVRRTDIVETKIVDLVEGSATVKVPITEDMIPNVFVQVDVVGEAPRTDDAGKPDDKLPKRPAFASGKLDLSVPPVSRTLAVKAAPKEARVDPGGETDVAVDVKDAAGNPVGNSEVAVVIVDEAVLALTSYKLGDPIATFYMRRGDDVTDAHMRGFVQLNDPAKVADEAKDQLRGRGAADGAMAENAPTAGGAPMPSAPGAAQPAMQKSAARAEANDLEPKEEAGSGGGEAAGPIRIRTDFNPLALFAPTTTTDASGHATVHVKVPDNLTRYRIMAVAVADGKQFGMGEDTVTARLPLMVRPSAPRFLNFGDKFELPVVLQNQTDKPMKVQVAVRAANATLTDGGGREVTVPANDRVEVRFPTTTVDAGTARFQFVGAAVGSNAADAQEISLPVWTPATSEAFAVYGEVDDSGAVGQPVAPPTKVFPQFGGLEITTSSTQLQALTDAVLYLVQYPFECGEQVSSRVLSVAALKDVLTAFKAEGLPAPDVLMNVIGKDIEKLRALQCDDGGFALWNRNELEWPWVSIHVTHALVMAKDKGFPVAPDVLERAKSYLQNIESHYPPEYGPEIRRTITSYALYVRHKMGDDDATKARALITEAGGLDKMPMESLGFLMMVMSKKGDVADIRTYIANHVTEEAGTAHFVTHYEEGTSYVLFGSDRRTDAILLEALIEDSPKSDLIPKIVRGLLAHRTKGHWSNTQEDTFILLALDRYFNTYEKVTPDFVARIWLGDVFAGEHKYKGRTTERHDTQIPMAWLVKKGGTPNLVLTKQGPGRLYYRLGMQYAPADLRLGPSEHGFSVERTYQAMDKPEDVKREADGAWTIKAGARVRVRITMVAPARRYHVALVDPLPAGLEAVNPVLAVSGSEPASLPSQPSDKVGGARRYYWWSGGWYEHQNLRDERAEAFCSLLWDGVYTYEYVCRATTPGQFVVPPAKAEEMYAPETFGRGATDIVNVK